MITHRAIRNTLQTLGFRAALTRCRRASLPLPVTLYWLFGPEAADVAMAIEEEDHAAIIGYIVMCAPIRKHGAGFFAPLAYGHGHDGEPSPDMLLRDRGATLFSTPADAWLQTENTITRAESLGQDWPKRYQFTLTTVYAPPTDS